MAERTQGAASRAVLRRRSQSAPQRVASHLRLVRPPRRRTAAETRRLARRDLGLLYAAAGSLTVVGLVMVLSAGSVSAAQGIGLESVREALAELLDAGTKAGALAAAVSNPRHVEALSRANAALARAQSAARDRMPGEIVALELRESLLAIGEVTGRTVAEDLLDRIFSKFCVGK